MFDGMGGEWFLVITCFPVIYGTMHLFGWSAQFPTIIERGLWRVATVDIMSCGASFLLFGILYAIGSVVSCDCLVASLLWMIFDFFLTEAGFFLLPFLYTLGTTYLLVESIRQLFYLPPEAFVVASWSDYLPHFS